MGEYTGMTLETISLIVFLASAGINYLAPHRVLSLIAGVSGIVAALFLFLGRQ
jgi:hypothetical protein